MRSRLGPVVVGLVLFGAAGPRLTAPHDKKAGQPFAYEPPAGLTPAKGTGALDEAPHSWVDGSGSSTFAARVTLAHSAGVGTVEESDLAQIVQGLPETFANEGVDWHHRRHETRVRPDGARVGLVEGDCVAKATAFLPGAAAELHFRRLQLVFPDDLGTSIVTAQFAEEEAAKWEPLFEASVDAARGVATRVPAAPPWMMFAWAGAGGVLGWLVSAMIATRTAAPAPSPAPAPARGAEEEDEEEEEEEEA
jgi:hypothetical protein